MYWDTLTHPEIAALDKSIPVLLPVAATEQHGPHLPLSTDRLIGEHFCRMLENEIPGEVLILPAVAVGCSEHHLDFSGTLSLQHDTFIHQLLDLAGCVARHGFRNLVVLNSHGGNQGAGQVFLERFGRRHPECRVVFATWWRLATEQLRPYNASGAGGAGHAGEFETSLMLLIAPELVRTDRIPRKENVPTFDWAEGDLLTAPRAPLYRTFVEMTPHGAYGEPQAATLEKGEIITRITLRALKKLVEELRTT